MSIYYKVLVERLEDYLEEKMQAIILAAGMGKRLKDLTADNTKCMVKVNGITIIERALRILDSKNLSKIVIVVGYKAQKLMAFIDSLKKQ